jgi:hypothetical protein
MMRLRLRSRAAKRAPALGVLCALLIILPAAAGSSGTVRVTAEVLTKLSVAPSGQATLVAKLQNGANKKEWYYVYAVNAGDPVVRAQIVVRSNRTWSGNLTATQTAGDKKKMDLGSGVLRYSATLPTTFAQAHAAPILGTTPIILATNHASGVTTYTHYFLLRVSQGSGSTAFGAALTYSAGQVSSVVSAMAQVTISFQPSN